MLLALAVGLVLRTSQWVASTSLWLDELSIARNIRDRGIIRLVSQELAHRQMAPPGFLIGVEGSSWVFGLGEMSLRLVPYLLSVLALYLSWRIAIRFLDGPPLVGILWIVAVSPALTWYAGNVKPYSGDAAAVLLLVLLALRVQEAPNDRRTVLSASLLGALAVLSSFPAVFVSAGLVLVLAVSRWRGDDGPGIRALAAVGLSWGVAAVLVLAVSFHSTSPELRDYMHAWWIEGFAPWPEGLVAVLAWIPERLFNALAHSTVFLEEAYVLAIPLALLAIPGAVALLRLGSRGALVLTPPMAALAVAGGGWYPMRGRTAVYIGYFLVLAGMMGFQLLEQASSRWIRWPGRGLLGVAVLPMVIAVLGTGRPPYRFQETRPILEELALRIRPDERLYAYCLADGALDFYGGPLGLDVGAVGGCYQDLESYLQDVEELEGKGRVWFFYTQWTPEQPFPDAMKARFEELGEEIDRIPDPYGLGGQGQAAAILYDLGDGPTDS